MRFVPLVAMPFALIGLVAGLTVPNPSMAGQESRFTEGIEASGILRITRHPVQMSIALWAMAHLMANGDAASLWFFGAVLALSLAGSLSLDRKKALEKGGHWIAFSESTSMVPFLAIASGRNSFRPAEIGLWRPALALLIYGILLAFHSYLFGPPPF